MLLPPLTRHALDISEGFSSLRTLADGYAAGGTGLPARVMETMTAAVISALFNRQPFEWRHHLPHPDRCSRLLYAVLHARWGHSFPEGTPEATAAEAFDTLGSMILELEAGLDGWHHLHIAPHAREAELRTPEAERSHLLSGVPVGDIHKMVPGLARKDPAWRESGPDIREILRMQECRRRKGKGRPFIIALTTQ